MRVSYSIILLFIWIIWSDAVASFFLENLRNIGATRNILCRNGTLAQISNNFQLCSIRIYHAIEATVNETDIQYDGFRYVNAFRQLILSSCNSSLNMGNTDIGEWSCQKTNAYETFSFMQLCICASDNCNENIDACRNSLKNSSTIAPLPNLMPNLTKPIRCSNRSNAFYPCSFHRFIEIGYCTTYVKDNGVLCAVEETDDVETQVSYIQNHYEQYLDNQIYQIKLLPEFVLNNKFNETDSNAFYVENGSGRCNCIISYCNENFTACIASTTSQIETTMIPNSSVNIYSSEVPIDSSIMETSTFLPTSESSTKIDSSFPSTKPSIIISFNITSEIMTSSQSSTTRTSTETTTIGTATETTTIGTGAQTTTIGKATETTTIGTATETTTIGTGAQTTTIGKATETTTTNTAVSTQQVTDTAPPASNGLIGEPGLGSSATAGIACGIVFSALLYTGEIIFFKFFYKPNISAEQYVYYQP